jgi:hypothetical protein
MARRKKQNVDSTETPIVDIPQDVTEESSSSVSSESVTPEAVEEIVIESVEEVEFKDLDGPDMVKTIEEIVKNEEILKKEETPTPPPAVTRKIGNVTVDQSFLNSNTIFFPWLHKQGYAIIARSTDAKTGHMTFTLEGGDLTPVSDGSIPEYKVHVAGNRLLIAKK